MILSAVALLAAAPARAVAPPADPESWALATYGPEVRYEVRRDGAPVGRHILRFERDGDHLTVRADFEMALTFLGFTVFEYSYLSTAHWRDGRLMRLRVTVDDNGDTQRTEARRDGDRMIIDGPKGRLDATSDLYPTNHWNPGVLRGERVLNTLTGGIDAVRIESAGEETLRTPGGPVIASRFVYDGDLQVESWYDREGRWVKLRFAGRDGSTIEYVCQTCPPARAASAR